MSFALVVFMMFLLVGMPWILFVSSTRRIEKRLDQQHDYFRYYDRELWTSPGSNPSLRWLKDLMAKYSKPEFEDPVLDELVERHHTIRTVQIAGLVVWAGFGLSMMMVAN